METKTITIPFSNRKNSLLFLGAFAFVASGCWLLFGNPKFDNSLFDHPWFAKIVGAASFVFFGFTGCFFIRNLMTNGPGLIVNDIGIDDYSSAVAVKIYWEDIEAIEAMQIQSQPIILVKVSNPQTYMDRARGFKRKMMAMNYKYYGTPLSISANGLQISFDELLQLISVRFETISKQNHEILNNKPELT